MFKKITDCLYMILVLLRSLISYALALMIFLIFGPLIIVASMLLTEEQRYSGTVFQTLLFTASWLLIKATFLSITIKTSSHTKADAHTFPALYVANHQSLLDTPLLIALIHNNPQIWYALSSWFNKPIIGALIRRVALPINRDHITTSTRVLIQGIRLAQKYQCDLMLFPEGGRYTDGEIHQFLPGFSLIAKSTNLPVIPVYIHNLDKAYPPKSILLHPYPITLTIGKPFYYNPEESYEAFAEHVRTWFVEQKQQHQKSL